MAVELLRIWNPPNPYLTEHRQWIGEPPAAELEVYEDGSETILSQNDSPDLGFTYSVNPYRGCFHACSYCMSGETQIAMANGFTKQLSDIRVGDEIYGTTFDGKYRRFVKTPVLAHWLTLKPACKITLEDGTELIASVDHRFLSNRGWKYVTGAEYGRKRRPHLTTNNHLLGVGHFTNLPAEDEDYQRGYLCGMIRGDGLIGIYNYDGRRRAKETLHQFRLALIDQEALQRTQRYLATLEISTHEFIFQKGSAQRRTMYAIRTSSRPQVDRIRHLIQWPVPLSLSWDKGFLAGIFDAEGSYSRSILRISNTDQTIINQITTSLQKLSFSSVVEKRTLYKSDKPIYTVRIPGGLREHLRFFQTTGPAISRKKDISGQAIKNRCCLRVVSIEPLRLSLPMFDVTTGTGDFIGNGVVSHNCYARSTHEYFGLGAGTDFDRKIFVKKNAPELLEQAFKKKSWKGDRIVFSGVTDCYQPLEAAWKLTRGCLEVCLKYRNPVSIITKSALIRRDLDLLQGLAREASLSVHLSIPFLEEEMARRVEPGAPTVARRFETMRLLAQANIPVGIGVAPIIPGLNDRQIPELLHHSKECGARSAFKTLLRLPRGVREVFLHRLRRDLPLQASRIEQRIREVRGGGWYDWRFGHRHHGEGPYWQMIEEVWDLWTKRLGFDEAQEPPRPSTFRRPGEGLQLEFDISDSAGTIKKGI